ncbi:hypothetical protein ABZX30_19365 [Streptomyces sp. NPDC004542]|uniref:hypothetical protein n=1 Tax=Streptomyces sp. NPDC004542 TaxID=3154281 RepID=UPI00339F9C71
MARWRHEPADFRAGRSHPRSGDRRDETARSRQEQRRSSPIAWPQASTCTDNFWRYIEQSRIPPYLPEAHRQNQAVLLVLVSAAFGHAGGGYHVVCHGVVGPWFIDLFRAAAREQAVPLGYVVLRPNQLTAPERATGRTGIALTDPEPIRSLHDQLPPRPRGQRHRRGRPDPQLLTIAPPVPAGRGLRPFDATLDELEQMTVGLRGRAASVRPERRRE